MGVVLSCSVGVVGVGGSVSLSLASIRFMEDSRLSTFSAQSVGQRDECYCTEQN